VDLSVASAVLFVGALAVAAVLALILLLVCRIYSPSRGNGGKDKVGGEEDTRLKYASVINKNARGKGDMETQNTGTTSQEILVEGNPKYKSHHTGAKNSVYEPGDTNFENSILQQNAAYGQMKWPHLCSLHYLLLAIENMRYFSGVLPLSW